ncbi:hypothetical protein HU200_011498 [Digitaria exilis]|uniref:F-box domain-containing protein n=1 Tax=Digitaria exilis TaxID=1010633 RepID=A0A835FH39_9POAL|nr:hypothetical protein HU200_011498 [Digitaria exilis]
MESNRRRSRRHRHRDKPPVAPKPAAGGAASCTVHNIPDHILELILLRLDSSACLVRAASACKRWCRVVADAGFQHRFRALRIVLGHFVVPGSRLGLPSDGGHPIFVPSPTWRSIHGHESSSSLDFVPKIADSRNGLLLLLKKGGRTEPSCRINPALVVCKDLGFGPNGPNFTEIRPFRYWNPGRVQSGGAAVRGDQLPAGAAELPPPVLGLFLLDAGRPGGVSLSNFKVVAVTLRDHRLVRGRGVPGACVYSANWHDVSCNWEGTIDVPNTIGSFFFAGRANGSLYWGTVSRGGASRVALVLDEVTAGSSQISVPVSMQMHGKYEAFFRVIGSEDGTTLRVVRLLDQQVRVHARLRGCDKWVLQTRVRLPVDAVVAEGGPVVVAAHETYVLVSPRNGKWIFSVDLETKAVERVRKMGVYHQDQAYPYEQQWPPTLTA